MKLLLILYRVLLLLAIFVTLAIVIDISFSSQQDYTLARQWSDQNTMLKQDNEQLYQELHKSVMERDTLHEEIYKLQLMIKHLQNRNRI